MRFCPVCNGITRFKYDNHVFHSCCVECGSRFGKKEGSQEYKDEKYRQMVKNYKKVISELNKKIISLSDKLKDRDNKILKLTKSLADDNKGEINSRA